MSADNNLVSFADQSGLLITGQIYGARGLGFGYDDVLKCSNLRDSTFISCAAYGGQENALDCNRFCQDLVFRACAFVGGEQAAIVIKGGCSNIAFVDCAISRTKKSWCDILVDDWSDQSRNPSRGLDLRGIYRLDGAKVRMVIGRGWGRVLPLYDPAKAEILFWKSAGVHLYNLGKGLVK